MLDNYSQNLIDPKMLFFLTCVGRYKEVVEHTVKGQHWHVLYKVDLKSENKCRYWLMFGKCSLTMLGGNCIVANIVYILSNANMINELTV